MLNWVGHSGKYDLNASHVRGVEELATLQGYILGFSIQGCRNLRGYRFPAFCNRAGTFLTSIIPRSYPRISIVSYHPLPCTLLSYDITPYHIISYHLFIIPSLNHTHLVC